MVAVAGLPASSRSAGVSRPWSMGVSDQMNQGICQLVDHSLVEFRLLSADLQFYGLAAAGRQVTHHAFEAIEERRQRDHAGFHHRALQVIRDARQ